MTKRFAITSIVIPAPAQAGAGMTEGEFCNECEVMMIVRVSGVRVPLEEGEKTLPARLAEIFSLSAGTFSSLRVLKKSLDARRNRPPFFVYSLEAVLPDDVPLPAAGEG